MHPLIWKNTQSRHSAKPAGLEAIWCQSMKGVKPLSITAVFTLALLALAWWAWGQHGWWLAHRWGSQLHQAPECQLDDLLNRIVRLGEPGIPVLVDALASGRRELAERAALAVADEIERWKTLPAETSGPRLTTLARALARQVEQLDPWASQRAVVIARRILACQGDRTPAGGQLLLCCEQVLRAASARASKRKDKVTPARTGSASATRSCRRTLRS